MSNSPVGAEPFKKSVEGFVRETLTMVRTSLREDSQVIDNILAMLSRKFKLTTPPLSLNPTASHNSKEDMRNGLVKLQREV